MPLPVAAEVLKISHMHACQRMCLDWLKRNPVGGNVLDLGCGQTGLSSGIAKYGITTGSKLYCIDAVAGALRVQQEQRFPALKVPWSKGWIKDLGKDQLPDGPDDPIKIGKWDNVICINCHPHLMVESESMHLLREIKRVLEPGGHLILMSRISERGETYRWDSRGDPMIVRTFKEMQAQLTEAGFGRQAAWGFTYSFDNDVNKETAEWTSLDRSLIAIVDATR